MIFFKSQNIYVPIPVCPFKTFTQWGGWGDDMTTDGLNAGERWKGVWERSSWEAKQTPAMCGCVSMKKSWGFCVTHRDPHTSWHAQRISFPPPTQFSQLVCLAVQRHVLLGEGGGSEWGRALLLGVRTHHFPLLFPIPPLSPSSPLPSLSYCYHWHGIGHWLWFPALPSYTLSHRPWHFLD